MDVYVAGPGGKVARAGTLDLAAPGQEGPTSAVPFLRVERLGRDLCVTATRDLVRSRPDGSYATVRKGSGGYVVRNGRLSRGTCQGARR